MSKHFIAMIACGFFTYVFADRSQLASAQRDNVADASTFEVASVKRNTSGSGQRSAGFQPGGRFTARNMTLRGLIAAAYGTPQPLPLYRIMGGPGWIDSDRFDIDARATTDLSDLPGKPGWSPRGQEMLRALLAERFRVAAHREERELPAYALVKARRDGRLGSRLVVSRDDECQQTSAAAASRASREQPVCGAYQFVPSDRVIGRHLTMDEIARFIMLNAVDRPVLNRTELSGHFTIDLEFTRGLQSPESQVATGEKPPAEFAGTSIFTAVQEQLGLKLEPTRTQLEVVVIDGVALLTPD